MRKRYGPGTKRELGRKFKMSMSALERKVEAPILRVLKSEEYSYICERVCGKKEHFWVKEEDVRKFANLVNDLIDECIH